MYFLILDLLWFFNHFPNLVIPSHTYLQQGHMMHTLYIMQNRNRHSSNEVTYTAELFNFPPVTSQLCYWCYLSTPHGQHVKGCFYKRERIAT